MHLLVKINLYGNNVNMKRFNIVLIPHEFVANAAIDFARTNFSHDHEDYCLGCDGHLPHVTLAQLEIPDDFDVTQIYNRVAKTLWNETETLSLGDYYHHAQLYNGVNITSSNALQNLHERVVSMCEDLGLEVVNPSGDKYWPHMTFAKTKHRLVEPVELPIALTGNSAGWKLEFGHAGNHWTYLGGYKPK